MIRRFFQRLNHKRYGVTELVAIDRYSGEIVATGLFDDEERFLSSCLLFNESCNVYAGRNPRFAKGIVNQMDTVAKKRAKDNDIKYLTAISLDIDPVRPKGEPASKKQRDAAVSFALDLQWDLGGDVYDSGNGAYLWFYFTTPILLTEANREIVKKQCRAWQEEIKQKHRPEQYGLKIDGCYDFSRIKRVIGTVNHKAERRSCTVRLSERSNRIRDEILAMKIEQRRKKCRKIEFDFSQELPERFKQLLKEDDVIRDLWENPDPLNDRSVHDWILGTECVKAGITEPGELAAILMGNPHGKFQRDGRTEYVRVTVEKLIEHRMRQNL